MTNVYFQPPSDIKMNYPCIVYSKNGSRTFYGNDKRYFKKQQYQIMLIERNPDSPLADEIEKHFDNCSIGQYYTVDNLNHTTLTLFY